jgi:hypothetical protein
MWQVTETPRRMLLETGQGGDRRFHAPLQQRDRINTDNAQR